MDQAVFRCAASGSVELADRKELFVQDVYAGADPAYRLPVRIITEYAWHSLSCRSLFIDDPQAVADASPAFTIIDSRASRPIPRATHQLRRGHRRPLRQKTRLIGGTSYAGRDEEVGLLDSHYFLPLQNVLSMHCSANVGPAATPRCSSVFRHGKDDALERSRSRLIGDDEHGWSDRGIFNFEGGC